jgi:protein subunit release factor A
MTSLKDLRIETFRNTAGNSVKITHIPTGIQVESNLDKSEWMNKRIAFAKLNKILLYKKIAEGNCDE